MSNPSPLPPSALIEHPPSTFSGILSRLGPGLIIAASIVGSGELIGTTKTGRRRRLLADVADPDRLRDQGLRAGGVRPLRRGRRNADDRSRSIKRADRDCG